MTGSSSNKNKNIFKNKNTYLTVIVILFLVALIFEIHYAYAYYFQEYSSQIIGNKIADFDEEGYDAGILIYKENDNGQYVRVYAVPNLEFYSLNPLASCSSSCTAVSDMNEMNSVALGPNPPTCMYTFDYSTNSFTVASEQNVSCKFYFDKIAHSDIGIIVLTESEHGNYTREVNNTTKNYIVSNVIPSVGYEYTNYYHCNEGSSGDTVITYNSSTRTFSVTSSIQNTCYVYFDSDNSADIKAHIYVQSSAGSTVYNSVSSIPSSTPYELNTSRSYCYDGNGNTLQSVITYNNGYISVDTTGKQDCDIYLDLAD